ncbi:NUDIX hydrolase [Virgisporangium ochraceum]|uniref:ADP-ribose pyrophosphatase n=1 Tax=Virgisporangium ochraceum TaxID=65505 RepID=A0A8J4EC65_9ACTN|nr:NUDIX hydrolase [Virgisporangium ochraceum]GIJ66552.1 ADP-ribose pyrophosphatase [Virgisporangium ochraceum]
MLSDEDYFASLPTFFAGAAGFFTDPAGDVLLVKPNYRDTWGFPGGVLEAGETPDEGAAREVLEEIGLRVEVGRLLVVDWVLPYGTAPRSMVHFLFDCGTVEAPPGGFALQVEELDEARFVRPDEAAGLLAPRVAPRVDAALRARSTGGTEYLTDSR